jgi:Uma2 family endonuclease
MAVEHLALECRPPLTVEEYYALAAEQGWDEDTRIELLDGEVVWMSPVNEPHAGCVNRLVGLFRRYPENVAVLSPQNPVRTDEHNEPQPDVTLLRWRADYYSTVKPGPSDVLLLIEIADSTLRMDLGRKARIYADANVAEYWVIDLNNEAIYVHRAPAAGGYAERQVLRGGEPISAAFVPEVQFTVNELLGTV